MCIRDRYYSMKKEKDCYGRAVRRKVYGYSRDNIPSSIDSLLNVVNKDDDLPTFKRTTFYSSLQQALNKKWFVLIK